MTDPLAFASLHAGRFALTRVSIASLGPESVSDNPEHLVGSLHRQAGCISDVGDVGDAVKNVGIRRTTEAPGQIVVIVGHDQQRASGRQGRCSHLERRRAFRLWQLEIEDGDQVEARWRGCPLLHGGLDPGDLDVPQFGEPPAFCQAYRREVHSRHLPTLISEPHRVAALTTCKVYRPTRREADDLRDEELVGCTRPHQFGSAVALIPLMSIH